MNITSPYIISLQKQIDNCKQEILPEEKLLKSLFGAWEGVTPSLREAKLDISLSERGVKLFQWEVKKNRVLFTRVS